ncbi:uncharacterized protein LOC144382181 [Halichoerus grypus]
MAGLPESAQVTLKGKRPNRHWKHTGCRQKPVEKDGKLLRRVNGEKLQQFCSWMPPQGLTQGTCLCLLEEKKESGPYHSLLFANFQMSWIRNEVPGGMWSQEAEVWSQLTVAWLCNFGLFPEALHVQILSSSVQEDEQSDIQGKVEEFGPSRSLSF